MICQSLEGEARTQWNPYDVFLPGSFPDSDCHFLIVLLAIHFIADDQGEFIAELGFLFDASGLLGGPRSKVCFDTRST
jgi:hypothetical protein